LPNPARPRTSTVQVQVCFDQKLVCEVAARPFGSKLDALLIWPTRKGTVLEQNDDANGVDARLEFEAKKDTEYVLALRDLTSAWCSFCYRLTIRSRHQPRGASFAGRFLPDTLR